MTIKDSIQKEILKTEQFITDCADDIKTIAPDCAIDHALRMESFTEQTQLINTINKAKFKLKKLKIVLNQANKPNFGLCKKCGLKIPIQRILLKPDTDFCVKCAS